MDRKEQWMVRSLHSAITSGNYTERDVFALLMLLRPFSRKDSPVLEFAHFVAHREKDRGYIRQYLERTKHTLENLGQVNKVLDIRAVFSVSEIAQDLNSLLSTFGLEDIDEERANQVTVCIISLLQDVRIVDDSSCEIGTLTVGLDQNDITLFGRIYIANRGVHAIFPALAAANRYVSVPPMVAPVPLDGVVWTACVDNRFSIAQVTAA